VDCVHHLFERQVNLKPDAEAFRCGGRVMRYQDLDDQANRLAHALQAHGVRRGNRVGVCLPRDESQVASLLAVLKAGACWVPLDPAYPADRLIQLAEDSAAVVVLTSRRAGEVLVGSDARLLFLEDLDLASMPGIRPEVPTGSRDLAYLIFTSGSTGRPKGVAVEHGSLAARLAWVASIFEGSDLDGVLAAASVSFDASFLEILAPLVSGGRFILVGNFLDLYNTQDRDRVRLIFGVPSAVAELVDADGLPTSVRTVWLGGEALPPALLTAVRRLAHVERIFNLYGPSEATILATATRLDGGPAGRPPIGRALPGTATYVLDHAMRQVPCGEAGELWLGGSGLARGYLGQPGMTADRFRPDPFSPVPGQRMYRTGDQVRILPDGQLDFLGRLDDQVKVRGFRIELGEVAAALQADPAVAQAIGVVTAGPGGGAPVLVSYVVPARGALPSTSQVLARLRRRVPAHLVPAALIWLDSLPVTPNGKLDRSRLPPVESWPASLPGARSPGGRVSADIGAPQMVDLAAGFDDLG
jgi:amino acid adenylation domain-containing protein